LYFKNYSLILQSN